MCVSSYVYAGALSITRCQLFSCRTYIQNTRKGLCRPGAAVCAFAGQITSLALGKPISQRIRDLMTRGRAEEAEFGAPDKVLVASSLNQWLTLCPQHRPAICTIAVFLLASRTHIIAIQQSKAVRGFGAEAQ